MNDDEKQKLEDVFDRKLTDGEAEEIDRQPIVPQGGAGGVDADISVIGDTIVPLPPGAPGFYNGR